MGNSCYSIKKYSLNDKKRNQLTPDQSMLYPNLQTASRRTMTFKYDRDCKVCIIGDCSVGKTYFHKQL